MKPLAFLSLAITASAADLFPFQLPWDDASPSITNVSWLNDKPAGRDGFVHVKDGHLFAGEKRLRIFGVNMCFAANFPTHGDAEKVAARLAKFGINCVRFHHMDMFNAPAGIFAKDGRTLDAEMLDRLDYFIAELKKHGIYTNLNLHVSRTYPDRPKAEKKGNPQFDKGVDNYHAPMIALQKDYARDLLTHVNKYTGNPYSSEPAVALVEINNENALGFQWFAGEMDDLPAPYAEDLSAQWTAWLGKKYVAGASLPRESNQGVETASLLPKTPAWSFENHGSAKATGVANDGAITFTVAAAGTEPWHAQFSTSPLVVEVDAPYAATFRVRAPKDMKLTVSLMQAHEPWKVLASAQISAGTDWRDVRAFLRTSTADDKARLTIGGIGKTVGAFSFEQFALQKIVLRDTPNMEGKVARYIRKSELSSYTMAVQRDWQEFIWDTEIAYWNGMRDFLRNELKVRAPIVGTQGFWSPGHVQAGMDVIDSHAYWHHPHFEGGDWNLEKWTIKNEPMAGAKDGGTLPGLAAQRVAGKPFICTEYNHSAPNTYGAETAPLLAAFAALQDWDGIFLFAYSHNDKWSQEHFNSFFDIARHPVKMATLPGAAVSFRRGDVAAVGSFETWQLTPRKSRFEALKSGPGFTRNLSSDLADKAFYGQVSSTFVPDDLTKSETRMVTTGGDMPGTPPQLLFFSNTRSSQLAAKRSLFAIGVLGAVDSKQPGDQKAFQGVTVSGKETWACYQLTVLDREEKADFSKAKNILIATTGDIANTDMGWKNAEKTTVGRDWGRAPVLVEGPAATIELPGGGAFKAWALDERGQRREEIPVANGKLTIGPQWKTLWYEVERQ